MALLEKKYIKKFQQIWKHEFGEDISYEKASSECMDMFILGKILLAPIKQKDIDNLEKKYDD